MACVAQCDSRFSPESLRHLSAGWHLSPSTRVTFVGHALALTSSARVALWRRGEEGPFGCFLGRYHYLRSLFSSLSAIIVSLSRISFSFFHMFLAFPSLFSSLPYVISPFLSYLRVCERGGLGGDALGGGGKEGNQKPLFLFSFKVRLAQKFHFKGFSGLRKCPHLPSPTRNLRTRDSEPTIPGRREFSPVVIGNTKEILNHIKCLWPSYVRSGRGGRGGAFNGSISGVH